MMERALSACYVAQGPADRLIEPGEELEEAEDL